MNNSAVGKSQLDLMQDLLLLSKSMITRQNDADYLIESVEKRQSIINSIDVLRRENPEETDTDEIKNIAKEVLRLDELILRAIQRHKAETKTDLTANNQRNKIMGYMNNAISSSGSYMDFKK